MISTPFSYASQIAGTLTIIDAKIFTVFPAEKPLKIVILGNLIGFLSYILKKLLSIRDFGEL
jgi:hypothetical protein